MRLKSGNKLAQFGGRGGVAEQQAPNPFTEGASGHLGSECCRNQLGNGVQARLGGAVQFHEFCQAGVVLAGLQQGD